MTFHMTPDNVDFEKSRWSGWRRVEDTVNSLHTFALTDGRVLNLAINVIIKRRLFRGIVKTPVFGFLPGIPSAREGMSLVCEFQGNTNLNFTATASIEPGGTGLYNIEPQFAEILHSFFSTGEGFLFKVHGPDGHLITVPVKSDASYSSVAMSILSNL